MLLNRIYDRLCHLEYGLIELERRVAELEDAGEVAEKEARAFTDGVANIMNYSGKGVKKVEK